MDSQNDIFLLLFPMETEDEMIQLRRDVPRLRGVPLPYIFNIAKQYWCANLLIWVFKLLKYNKI